MIEIAIALDEPMGRKAVLETNSGRSLVTEQWPRDCEVQVVAFREHRRACEIVYLDEHASDITKALTLIESNGLLPSEKPSWFKRLKLCSADSE